MKIQEQGKSAMSWSLIDKIFKRGVTFIISIFLARILEPSDFGIVAMSGFFVAFADTFREFGFGQAIVLKQRISNLQLDTLFYVNTAIGVFFTVLLFFLAPVIGEFYNNTLVTSVVKVSSVIFIIKGAHVVTAGLINKDLRYDIFAKAMMVSSIASGSIAILMAYTGFGVWSLVWYSLIGSVVNGIMLWWLTSWRPGFLFQFKSIKGIGKTGLAFLNIGIINNVMDRLDELFIGKVFNESLLGFYSRAKGLQTLPESTLIAPMTRPLFPMFSKVQGNAVEFKKMFDKVVDILFYIIMLIFGVLLLNSSNVILIAYSDKWSQSIPFFSILLFLLPLVPVNLITTAMLKGIGRLKLLTVISILDRLAVILAIPFGYFYGLKEFAIAYVSWKYVTFFVRIYLLDAKMHIQWLRLMSVLAKTVFVFLVAFIPVYFWVKIDNIYVGLVCNSLVFLLVYVIFSKLMKIHGYNYLMDQIIVKFGRIIKR